MIPMSEYEFLSVGLLVASIDAVRSVLKEEGFLPPPFGSAVGRFAPLNVYGGERTAGAKHPWRAVFYEPSTSPGTTVMLSNLDDGWLSLLTRLSMRLPGQQYRIRDALEVSDLYVLADGRCIRYVGVLLDDARWTFSSRGAPLWFEEPQQYQRRRIRDRVDRDLLLRYARKLGWDLTDPRLLTTDREAIFAGQLD